MDNGESHDGMWQSWQHLVCSTGHTVGCGMRGADVLASITMLCVSLSHAQSMWTNNDCGTLLAEEDIRKSIIHCVIFMHAHIMW